jgi:hypothetical protein
MSELHPASQVTTRPAKIRDVRLDFFRGFAMLFIFVAHVPGGWLFHAIPARFGLSDAAHMFVFISGYAAAIAFGGTFLRHGFAVGTARIAFRCLQIYATHLGLFLVVIALCALAADLLGGFAYAARLNIGGFFVDPAQALIGLVTLTYVPTFFDILPLYMVVLAMVPIAVLLARIDRRLPIAVSIALWLFVQFDGFALPAGYAEGANWGFNPFAWQLIFITGYSFSSGWIKPPALTNRLATICGVFVALSAAMMVEPIYMAYAPLHDLRDWILAHAHKPDLDIRQFAHFLATVVLALWLVDRHIDALRRPWATPFVRLGQQALIVFVTGMTLSHLGGMLLATYGTDLAMQILVNGGGFACLFAVAYGARWIKNAPWKRPPAVAKAQEKRESGVTSATPVTAN